MSQSLDTLRQNGQNPLTVDCRFGQDTETATKLFQTCKGLEPDGKIGPVTWTFLARYAAPSSGILATVEDIVFTNDSFSAALSWDQVIGLDTTQVNIKLEVSFHPSATVVDRIPIELTSRSPNRSGDVTTLDTTVSIELPLVRTNPRNPNRHIYQVSSSISSVGDFLQVERSRKEVATIVRVGGTSDAEFRRALGWNQRGTATQPSTLGSSSGSEATETPDAFALFKSAGVEVLEARVAAQPHWDISNFTKRLIRSPADVVYYSGHGLSSSGKLAIDIESKPCGERGTYRDWLGATDLSRVWRSPMDLDVLILAGCSVLNIDFSTSPASGPGVEWINLLQAKGGPVVALLGYRRGAPCDAPVGNKIASLMGERMERGSINFAQDWLKINGENNANNAVAIDSRGYWHIEGTFLGGYDIKGPRALP